MASKKTYLPPVSDQIEEIEEWLLELEIWQCVAELEQKKQTLYYIYLRQAKYTKVPMMFQYMIE